MTTKTIVTCDFCGTTARGTDVDRWGKLEQNREVRDVCLGCIAKLMGWRRTG